MAAAFHQFQLAFDGCLMVFDEFFQWVLDGFFGGLGFKGLFDELSLGFLQGSLRPLEPVLHHLLVVELRVLGDVCEGNERMARCQGFFGWMEIRNPVF